MDREKNNEQAAAEPVRSRWTPKPEQIIILENIFNSGTVNPAKDETIKIRKILEQYGSVGDANVFYWFQNRRSRSRRRQRQLQAAAVAAAAAAGFRNQQAPSSSCSSSSNAPSSSNNSSGCGSLSYTPSSPTSASNNSSFMGRDGSCTDDLFSISRQMGCMDDGQNQFLYSSDAHQLQYQAGTITVFINGIPSEVPRGPFDMRTMLGQDAMLVHSSGELLAVNEYGILLQGLQMGESYFLVSRHG